ncbi:NAD(P)H:quinone oxidoreductase [Cumulibacter manganitolerans]|uniref:NAD(P)H:quinone oxidoreductase n=1 Tax=Cumulibacter manganitolerans TaxID=1884992 RepID=UPI0012968570|nr:NAD(P)H:quinone oxidoreductase [Cumulibacter manganitolerans]
MRDEDLRRTTVLGSAPTTRRRDDPLKVAVIYYSATGSVHALAQSVADGARAAGGSVRTVRVAETVPREVIERNPLWARHRDATERIPVATLDDVGAADVILLGTPTRFGHVSSQLQAFIDTWGELWGANAFAEKVFAAFTSSATAHGGQETTLMSIYTMVCHLGGIIVPPGYTEPSQIEAGNPYGAASVSRNGELPPTDIDLRAAELVGRRATRIAGDLRAGRALRRDS